MDTMHRTHGWMLLAGLAVASAVGCGSSQAVTRGQSPGGIQPAGHHPAAYANGHHGGHPAMLPGGGPPFGGCPTVGCPPGHGGFGGHPGHGPAQYGEWTPVGSGWDGGWGGGGIDDGGPIYETPRKLSYPPAHVPPSFVQYPYYTLKGPSDFFMQ
jgi:hypothetical protein